MQVLEYTSLFLMILLCIISSKSDLTKGIIKNKILAIFAMLGVVIDVVYYGYFVRDLFFEFLLSFLVVTGLSLFLFFSHIFAGGDCKFTIVLTLLYPARFYMVLGSSNITLYFSLGFAIFAGYCFLLVNSIYLIATKKTKITGTYIKKSVLLFLKSYIVASLYVSLINYIVVILGMFEIGINVWIIRFLCMLMALCVGKFSILKKKIPIIVISTVSFLFSIVLKSFPFSTNPENYILVLIILFCQMAIKTNIYDTIEVSQLKKGMILSTMSSVIMQKSRIKGLPKVSFEDLRSRLTESEIESIKSWAKSANIESLAVVKKIPFAVFISIGFIIYYILWSIFYT